MQGSGAYEIYNGSKDLAVAHISLLEFRRATTIIELSNLILIIDSVCRKLWDFQRSSNNIGLYWLFTKKSKKKVWIFLFLLSLAKKSQKKSMAIPSNLFYKERHRNIWTATIIFVKPKNLFSILIIHYVPTLYFFPFIK